LDEGTYVSRPTQAIVLEGDLYRILATASYDPDDEHWAFLPGSVVRCIISKRGSELILIADEKIE
jgi:hypothetical protein